MNTMPKKLTREIVNAKFNERGDLILTAPEYEGCEIPLSYICKAHGHTGQITWGNFSQGHGCSGCGGTKKHTQELADAAFLKAGYLLKDDYIDCDTPMYCYCIEGKHFGYKTLASVLGGHGCNTCRRESDAVYLCGIADGIPVYKEISELPATSGVYQVTCTANNSFYIGSTTLSLKVRLQGHLSGLRSNLHGNVILQNCFNKYGESSFVFQILEQCEPDLCIKREQHYIDTLKPTINIRIEACHNRLGTKNSEEQNRRQSVRLSKKYTVRSPEGAIYMEVIGLRPFCRIHNLPSGALNAVANGKYKQYRGWAAKHWDGTTDGLVLEAAMKYTVRSPESEFFHVSNMNQLCKLKGLSQGSMANVISGKQSHHQGWTGKRFDGTNDGL